MKNKIPFSLVPFNTLKNISHIFLGISNKIERNFPSLRTSLDQVNIDATPKEYIAMCIMASFIFFIFINIPLNILISLFSLQKPYFLNIGISIALTIFIFFQQILYPKIQFQNKSKDIERNLLPVLQDMLIQLSSGIPLFRIIVNISNKDYGYISKDFTQAVNKINSGFSQIEVLYEVASKSSSIYFRRAIWQLVNGMKTGADTTIVLKEVIDSLSEEQLIQIQKYAGQLNPLVMFYMIMTIIMPSLGMTFLIVISSFISAQGIVTKLIFWGLYGLVFFFQIMFLGLIKVKRPSLLET